LPSDAPVDKPLWGNVDVLKDAQGQAARFCDEVMMASGSGRNALIICASVLALAVLYFARSVFAPAAVSLFAVAVERLPQLIALAITLLLTVFILSAVSCVE